METLENRARILIVDDQEPMRLLLAHYVSKEMNAEINLAGTCEDALHLVDENTYDAILLDLLMPGIGGFEVLKYIRKASASNTTTPVIIISILVSSLAGEGAMGYDHAVQLGVDAFLQKPIDRSLLISTIKTAVAKAQLRAKTQQREKS